MEPEGNEIKNSWFLTRSIWPSVFFVAAYLAFVLKIGPEFMKNRKPYNPKAFILSFNLFLFLSNTYMWLKFLSTSGGFTYLVENSCHPSKQEDTYFCNQKSFLIWFYYVTKLADLFDTVFFVLKKKNSQVTFLHTYHHACMVLGTWYFGINLSGSQALIAGGVNTIIHSIMYAYYFLSALGPKIQKYLWWKVYLTRMQMLQFIFIIGYMVHLRFNKCTLPESLSYVLIIMEISFFILFTNFYVHAYILKKKKPINDESERNSPIAESNIKKVN